VTQTAVLPNDVNGVAVQVTGTIIGTASSKNRESLRWNEVDIWLTQSGQYVVHKRGMSKVYHNVSNGCSYGKLTLLKDLEEDTSVPCPVCKPPESDDGHDTYVRMEKTRSSVHICATPNGVIESLFSVDEEGVRFMTRVSANALKAAVLVNPALGKGMVSVS
jgi:hypothetical protein